MQISVVDLYLDSIENKEFIGILTNSERNFFVLIRHLIENNENDEIQIGHEYMAKIIGCTAHTSKVNIKRLENKGMIIVRRTGRFNFYRLPNQ